LFSKLLTQKQGQGLTALFHSDIELMMDSLQHDFPEIVKVSSIGKSFEGRPIKVMEVDAREALLSS